MSEASCPNFEPRAHARLTGLTNFQPALVAARERRMPRLLLEHEPSCLGSPGFVVKRREEPRSSARALSNLLSARSLLSHAPKGASKMLRATGHARMVSKSLARLCAPLVGLQPTVTASCAHALMLCGPLFPARAKEKGKHNMGAHALHTLLEQSVRFKESRGRASPVNAPLSLLLALRLSSRAMRRNQATISGVASALRVGYRLQALCRLLSNQ